MRVKNPTGTGYLKGSYNEVERKSGTRYRAHITMGYREEDGERKRIRESEIFETEEEARDWIKKQNRKLVNAGGDLQNSKKKLADFLKSWLEEIRGFEVKESTWDRYKSLCRNHIIPSLGRKKIGKLQSGEINKFLRNLRSSGRNDGKDGGLATSTRRQIYAVLSKSLKRAFKDGLIDENPMEHVDRPSRGANEESPKDKMTVLDEKQIRTLIEASPEYPSFKQIKQGQGTYYGLFPVAVMTGMRRGELLGLRWEDVDFEEKIICVRKNLLQLSDGSLEYTSPKSEHSKRDIDMYEQVEFFLQRRRDLEDKKRDYLGEAWEGEKDLVFSNRFGAPIDPTNVTRKLSKVLQETELPDMRFQDLRHTAATHLVNNIDDPRSAAHVLGHGTVSFTFDRYGDSLPEKREEAVQNYGDQVFGEGDDHAVGA